MVAGLYRILSRWCVGLWNDMNEPSVFLTPTKTMPLDNVHRTDDGAKHPHAEIHNVFGMENVRATYDGLRKITGRRTAICPDARRIFRGAAICCNVDRRQQQHMESPGDEHATTLEYGNFRLRHVGDDIADLLGRAC